VSGFVPSSDHEMPLELFRNQPVLAPTLLEAVFGLKMPDYTHVCLGSETFTDVDPTEYRSDATIILGNPSAPDLAIVLEVQLRPDRRKRFTWPVYLATLRARRECPVTLLVLCGDATTAAACTEPIETGHPDWILKPLVLSPERLPAVTDVAEAQRLPELAVLSALAHADGPDRQAVLNALDEALEAANKNSEKRGHLYYDYVVSRLSVAARHSLEEIMSAHTYEYQSDFARKYYGQGKAEGTAEGEVRAILVVLDARDLSVSDEARTRITSCTDLDQLEIWVRRAATVGSAEDLFD
jgi:hypothetical protein